MPIFELIKLKYSTIVAKPQLAENNADTEK
jgi:hypothetical protein